MGFIEGRIDDEKLFGDVVFPKTLLPLSEDGSLPEMIKRECEPLTKMLQKHGAILFRGFNVESAEEFDRVVEAFGWEYMEQAIAVKRTRITGRVYTANESPLHQFINFHHEMSLIKEWPSKIFFYCGEPPPEGGETPIVPSHVIVDKMEERLPDIMEKVSKVGLVLRIKTTISNDALFNKTWQSMYNTNDEVEAQKRGREKTNCSSVNLGSDGSVEMIYGPQNPMKEFGEKRAWFMPILGFTSNINDVNLSFGDGSVFPLEAVLTYRALLEDNCVDVKWQKGDVLLLDNNAVQHARRPGKPPRVILVAVTK